MESEQKDITRTGSEKLYFSHLPDYARFLLDYRLEELVQEQIRIAREVSLPALRFFNHLTDEQLLEMGVKQSQPELLQAMISNSLDEYIDITNQRWLENQLEMMSKEDIVAEDITLSGYLTKASFLKFLPGYTADINHATGIMQEIDRYLQRRETLSFKSFMKIQEAEISRHLHFIERITDTMPGIVYVYDMMRAKGIYTNMKVRDYMGYTRDELGQMGEELLFRLLHPDDFPVTLKKLEEVQSLEEGRIISYECRVMDKWGSYRWIRNYVSSFRKAVDGSTSQILGFALNVTEEKEIEARLHRKEAQLLEAQAIARLGSFEWDISGRNSTNTPEMYKIFELDNFEDNTLDWFMSFVHPSDRARVQENLDKAFNGDGNYECEFRYVRNGNEKVLWSKAVVYYEDGKPAGLKGTVMDVTDRHYMVKRLERNEELYKQAQAIAHIGNWSWEVFHDKVNWSDEMYRIFGIDPSGGPITYERYLSIVHPDDREMITHHVKRCLEEQVPYEFDHRVVWSDGQVRTLQSRGEALADHEGKVYKLIGTTQDVTEAYELRHQLEQEKNFAEMLIENSPGMVSAYDSDFRVTVWNRQCELHTGVRKEDILGRSLIESMPYNNNPEWAEAMKKRFLAVLQGEELHVVNQKYASRDGYYDAFFVPLRKTGEDITGILIIAHDTTEMVRTAQKLNELNKELEQSNRELSSFNYVASHDLQEPLRKIMLFSNRIMDTEHATLSAPAMDHFQRILRAVQRMQKLLDDLLEFSRTHTSGRHFDRIDLNVVLSDVRRSLHESIEESGATIHADQMPVVPGVGFQLNQLFTNIVHNAIKYRKADVAPVITINVRQVGARDIPHLEDAEQAGYTEIAISDNGIGFEQRYADKIFEVFQRLHDRSQYEGTGIGLAICKKIMQNHEGYIHAESQPGVGATFRLYFPVR